MWKQNNDKKADPSGIRQHFIPLQPEVHCCRYWKLTDWEYSNMSFPFWRLYYNTIPGATVTYNEKEIDLKVDNILIIAPFTSFSTRLSKCKTEGLSGKRIETAKELYDLERTGMTDHLFIHFNLGFHYDHIKPDLYNFNIDKETKQIIDDIRIQTIWSVNEFDMELSAKIYALILKLTGNIKAENWKSKTKDPRVLKIIEYIDVNYSQNLTNESLSEIVALAPNSLLRLFKGIMGLTIHKYILQIRINKSILEMHNHALSIDEVAFKSGFNDRHHFSKVFKQVTGLPPGEYRKNKFYR
ncbi:MAG: AraC family transcriptional regulator [Prolixibacteraceae bacterium]|jgi:AraC-like DNA-binding protein|nr:AraC family transcriptional regulator [Prolixibacteraceae bacterium]